MKERLEVPMLNIMKKVLVHSLLMLVELYTILTEIQVVINDRPHTVINPDMNEFQPLTPNHLLFGFNITSLPHPSLNSNAYDPNYGDAHAISHAQHYRAILYRHFLQRFHSKYLSLLQETHDFKKNMWLSTIPCIKEGDVTLVADKNTPHHRWSLGVITQLLRGSDDLGRAAVVCITHGHTTRSIVKLFPLELTVSIAEVAEQRIYDNHILTGGN